MVLKWGNGDSGTKTFNFATIVRGPNNSYSSGTATVSILSSENSYETIVQGIGITTTVGGGFLYTFFFNIRILCNRSIFSNS